MSPLETPPTPVWRGSDQAPPDPHFLRQTLAGALRVVVQDRPEAPALIHAGAEIPFAALLKRVRGMAAAIQSSGAPPGPVALLCGPTPLAVAAWFACGMAGRPFLLLEPANPPERNRLLIAKAGATLLLHDLPPPEGLDIACLPADRMAPPRPPTPLPPDAPAMLFPTSGSTGEPKLITYAARTLQVKLRASQTLMGVAPGDRVLIAGSHANYGFLHHAVVFLLAGGTLCLTDVREAGLAGIFAAITGQGVRHVRFTPSLFRLAAARPEGAAALSLLQGLRFSGEPLLTTDLDLARRAAPRARIQNVYGSTESALFLWTDAGRALPPGTVPIGRIYPMWRFALLDEAGAPVRRGEIGELVIRSAHHALGDWQDGAVDTSRFAPAGPVRLYPTGDIARLNEAGDLEILGRKDRVVKVGGQRISLDEIESHLTALPGVGQAAVVVNPGAPGNPLVAFVTGPGEDPRPALSQRLPAHMIPGRIVRRDTLPLLPGGKTDRKALLASLAEAPVETRPNDGLQALFARLLKLPHVGPDADFFSLGGDSLLLMDLTLEIETRFGVRLDRRAFLRRATCRELARQIGQPLPPAPPTIGRAEGLELDFHQIAPGAGGAVLILPGVVGGAGAEIWQAADSFLGHALWACDARFARGRTIDAPNWHRVITAATAAIATGKAPEPAVLGGYSLAGFLGWATARALGSDNPARVLMLDSWPIHLLPAYKGPAWQPAQSPRPPQALLLACADPPRLRLPNAPKRRWPEDCGPFHRLVVPTPDHSDICKPAVLQALAPLTRAFARHGLARPLPEMPRRLPTLAAHILSLWQSTPDPTAIEAVLADRAALQGKEAETALLYLAALYARPALAKALARDLAAKPDGLPFYAEAARLIAALPDQAPPADPALVFPRGTPMALNRDTLVAALKLRA